MQVKYIGLLILPLFIFFASFSFKLLYVFSTFYLSYCLILRIFKNRTSLSFSPTPKILSILQKSGLEKLRFRAHFFFPSAFFQTFLSSFDTRKLSFQKPIELRAIQYRVPEAETTLDLVFYPWEDINSETTTRTKTLMILPGLTGSINAAYIQELCQEALQNKFRPMVLNSRWLAKPVKLPKTGPMNFISDLDKTVKYITEKFKVSQMYGIGISYGSNMLCKYLGTLGRNSVAFKGAVSIGNPFNLHRNKDLINRFWNFMLCKILQKALAARKKSFKNTHKACYHFVDVESALKASSFIVFDEYFTRRMLGYKSTDEYYKKFSSISDLKNVKVPLLCLQSKDDPISHFEVAPIHEFKKNENLIFMTTERGGHIGWIEGIIKPKVFYPKPCIQFLNSL